MADVLVVDPILDTGRTELYRIARKYDLPSYVKTASEEQAYQPPRTSDNLYLDSINKRWPCHTKAATWLSYAYFVDQKDLLPAREAEYLQGRLDKMAAYWGIAGDVRQLKTTSDKLQKQAAASTPDDHYALVVDIDGRTERHYPLRHAAEVRKAAEWLQTNRSEFTFSDRHTMANKILKRAHDLNVDLAEQQSFVESQAGHGIGDPRRVRDALRVRATVGKFATESRVKLKQLAAAAQHIDPRDRVTACKLAAAIDEIDRAGGLAASRGQAILPYIEDVLFGVTTHDLRLAKDAACRLTNGSLYDRDDFTKLSLQTVSEHFGDDFADMVRSGLECDPAKLAEQASILPADDADLFDRMAAAAGVARL